MVKKYFSQFVIIMLCIAFFLTISNSFYAFADEKERVVLSDKAIFLNEKPEYKPYIRDNVGFFGSGWSYSIYGSYSQGVVRFSPEEFKKLSVGEFAQTGVGTFTNENVEPFATYYWQPETVGEADTNFIAISLLSEENIDTDNKFLSFCFEQGGKAVLIQYNGEVVYADNNGVEEPVSYDGFVTDFAPRLNVNSYFEGHEIVPYNVLRLYVDYQANKFYMANGEDASLENGKLLEFNVDWSLCENLSAIRVIPYTVNNLTGGFSFMIKELMGKSIENAYVVPYGRVAEKYATGDLLKPPKHEFMVNDNDQIANVSLKKGTDEILCNDDGTFSLSQQGEYTLTYYYEAPNEKIYIKEYVFSVVDKTVITVKAPILEASKIIIEDGLPILRGETPNGVYRWKTGQTAELGTKVYEWEFVPLDNDPTIEYQNASGSIELTFIEETNGGCGGSLASQSLMVVVLAGLALVIIVKNKIKNRV